MNLPIPGTPEWEAYIQAAAEKHLRDWRESLRTPPEEEEKES